MNNAKVSLDEHIKHEHQVSSLDEYTKEIVYGGIDGIVTTFAVVAGFAGAGSQIEGSTTTVAVLLFGLANLFADGFSMALGNVLSLRSEKSIYASHKQREAREIKHHPELEGDETLEILEREGYQPAEAKKMLTLYKKNPAFWLKFMMNYELELPNPENINPYVNGLVTFFSFLFFGSISLIPYFLNIPLLNNFPSFNIAIFFTFLALVLLGIIRWKSSNVHILKALADTLTVGVIAGIIAFSVGTIFK